MAHDDLTFGSGRSDPEARAVVSLRLFGDDLVPRDVSQRLGCAPTRAYKRGERIVLPGSSRQVVAKCGMWNLRGNLPDSAPVPEQIAALLASVTDDAAVWDGLAADTKMDVFVGLWPKANADFALSNELLHQLGARHLQLRFDVYGQ